MNGKRKAISQEAPGSTPPNTVLNGSHVPTIEIIAAPDEIEHASNRKNAADPTPVSVSSESARRSQQDVRTTKPAPERHDGTQHPNLTYFVFRHEPPAVDIVAENDRKPRRSRCF